VGGNPIFIDRGEGAFLFDVEGRTYIDFCMSWGPLILGHSHPEVVNAVKCAVDSGLTFGAPCRAEVELAEFITSKVGFVEKIRFVSSGTEAVMSAVRVARGFTGREEIVKFDGCYHGHADHLLVKAGSGLATFGTPSSAGVPNDFAKHTLVAELDSEDSVRELFDRHGADIAAVIIEPIPANCGLLVQRPDFLKYLRQITKDFGSLLIFDEVITGFRVGWGGAAEMYDIAPDLVTYGKVIGGGMPVGAFGGRSEIMDKLAPDGPVYQAGTLSGNPVAMAAGLATLGVMQRENLFSRLEEFGAYFETALQRDERASRYSVARVGSILWLYRQKQKPTRASQIQSEGIDLYNHAHRGLLDRGIYLPPSGYEVMFTSSAHTLDQLDLAADVLSSQAC
jgi:glutamate-1-semialdehyde 2,1-aminomutase